MPVVEKINLLDEVDRAGALFEYRRVGSLNGQMLNVLRAEGRTLDFHVHGASDELFYVIEGEMDIEFEDGLRHLCAGELIIVPAGVRHRPVVAAPVKCLLVEAEGTLNSENTGGSYVP